AEVTTWVPIMRGRGRGSGTVFSAVLTRALAAAAGFFACLAGAAWVSVVLAVAGPAGVPATSAATDHAPGILRKRGCKKLERNDRRPPRLDDAAMVEHCSRTLARTLTIGSANHCRQRRRKRGGRSPLRQGVAAMGFPQCSRGDIMAIIRAKEIGQERLQL